MTTTPERIELTAPLGGIPGRSAPRRGRLSSRSRERIRLCVKWILFLFVFFGLWMGWASIAYA